MGKLSVVSFQEVAEADVKILGGKAASLVEMQRLGLPVPPGIAVTTGVCRAYSQEGRLPRRLSWQLQRGIGKIEKETGKKLGGAIAPLLLSIRSGAPMSMPGMMETILNVGITPAVRERLSEIAGDKRFGWQVYRNFLQSWATAVIGINPDVIVEVFREVEPLSLDAYCLALETVIQQNGGVIPAEPMEQVVMAIEAVCRSWNSPRAVDYRREYGISDFDGTAATVQMMVFGNLNKRSATGVAFSRDVANGSGCVFGEYLPFAQGEEIVSGVRTPKPISEMESQFPAAYAELSGYLETLEDHHNDVVDTEFTVEDDVLWMLQCRKAKRSPAAELRIAGEMVKSGRWSRQAALKRLQAVAEKQGSQAMVTSSLSEQAVEEMAVIASGIPASPGIVCGLPCKNISEVEATKHRKQKAIFVAHDTSPDDFAAMLSADGFLTEVGGKTSHAAVVAREMAKPAVVGANGVVKKLADWPYVCIDGNSGLVYGAIEYQEAEPLPLDEESLDLYAEVMRKCQRPRIRLELLNKRFCANELLSDYYVLGLLATEVKVAEVDQAYLEVRKTLADAFATYLFIAVAGEIRYGMDQLRAREDAAWIKQAMEPAPWGPNTRNAWQKHAENIPESARVEFALRAMKVFDAMPVPSKKGGVGGPKWGRIAEALWQALSGQITAGAFVDRVWDLRHNGGVLFNKHEMFKTLSHDHALSWQLDQKKAHTGSALELVLAQAEVLHQNICYSQAERVKSSRGWKLADRYGVKGGGLEWKDNGG